MSGFSREFWLGRWSDRGLFLLGLFAWNVLWTYLFLLGFLPSVLLGQPAIWGYTFAFAGFVQLLFFVGLYFPLSFLSFGRMYRWALLLEGVRLFFLIYDLLIFRRLGVHLYSPLVVANVHYLSFFRDIGVSASMIWATLGLSFFVLALQWGFLWTWSFLWQRFKSRAAGSSAFKPDVLDNATEKGVVRSPDDGGAVSLGLRWCVGLGLVVALSCVVGYLKTPTDRVIELNMYLPFYKALDAQLTASWRGDDLVNRHLKARQKKLRYPLKKIDKIPIAAVRRPDILMWSIESLRADVLNPEDMPRMIKRLQGPGFLIGSRHYSGSHISQEGVFSLIYALQSNYYKTFAHQPAPPATLQILRKLGYQLISLTGVTIRYPGYKTMLTPFHRVEDFGHLHPLEADRKVFARAHEILAAHKKTKGTRRPLFLLLTCNATHHPYAYEKQDEVFRPVVPERYDQLFTQENFRLKLWNRYRNAVRFLDRKIDEILSFVGAGLRAGRIAWALVGDHGETFWDHGLFGHGPHLNNATTQTPFVMSLPGYKAHKRVPLSSHVDVFPTLFDWMKVSVSPQSYSNGRSLLGGGGYMYVAVNANHFPLESNAMLVTRRHKIVLRRTELFGLEINRVLGLDDRESSWKKEEIAPVISAWKKEIDRFTPGFRLWRYPGFRIRELPHHPFVANHGPVRTVERPELRPWDRVGRLRDFVGEKEPNIQLKRRIKIGDGIEVVGVNIHSTRVRVGETFSLELIFYCRRPPKAPWRLFFHLDLQQHPGLVIIRNAPVFNHYPAWKWKAGQYIRDVRQIQTQASWRVGKGFLRVGLLHPKTLKRAPVDPKWGDRNSAKVLKLHIVR